MKNYLTLLKQSTVQDNVQLLTVIFSYFSELDHYPFETILTLVAESMQKTDIAHFDLIDTFRDKKAGTLQLQAGDITHPNGEGNRIAAEAITEQILQLGLIH